MTSDEQNPATQNGGEWWKKPFSVFQTNLQEVDVSMNVDEALEVIEAYGADTWLINVGGIFSFYPTELAFQTRVPLLTDRPSGDLIGDAVTAAMARGIRVLARCDFSKVSSALAAEHPEWLFVSPEGKPQIFNALYSTCPSGEYYQERSLDVVDEILDRYDVAGFFFNWFKFPEADYARVYHGVCHCEACKVGFARHNGGAELPDGPTHPNYGQWRRFCGQVIEELNRKIDAHIRKRRDDVGLVLKRGAPIFYYEANNAFGRDFWPHATSEAVSAHVTGWPEAALMVNCVSFVDMPYRMAGEQPEHFAQYQLQAIARGGNLSTYIMGAPGRIAYPSLSLGGDINRFYRENYPLYEDLVPAATIGLVRPDPIGMRADPLKNAVDEFRGVFAALKERGLPFDVLDPIALSEKSVEQLARYNLLVLPNLGAVGGSLGKLLDNFVLGGGHVVLTGTSAVTEQGEIEMRTAPALMRNGAAVSGQDLWSSYVASGVDATPPDFSCRGSFIPVFGAFSRFVWKPKAIKHGAFVPQAPYGPPEKCYGHEATSFPGKVELASNGTVVQIPWSIGATYHEFGTSKICEHLLATIEPFAAPIVRADLPGKAEVILGRSGGKLVVHIINQSGERRRSFGPHLPMRGGSLFVSGKVAEVTTLVGGERLSGDADGAETTQIRLPELGLFEVVTIQGS